MSYKRMLLIHKAFAILASLFIVIPIVLIGFIENAVYLWLPLGIGSLLIIADLIICRCPVCSKHFENKYDFERCPRCNVWLKNKFNT